MQTVVIMATALMRHDNQESVLRQVRHLAELLYPEDPEKKLEQEEALKDVLRREGEKSYKVMKVDLGERSG